MKRTSLIALFAAILAIAAFAQAMPGKISLENTLTQGLFLNDIDTSFTWTSGFGKTGAPFIFAGASGNPLQSNNITGGSALQGGYYQPGSIPFSVFLGAQATGLATAIPNGETTKTYATKTNVSGSTTTNIPWAQTETTATYAVPSALSTLNLNTQGILKVAGVVTGLVFSQSGDWSATNSDAAFYGDTTTKVYYDAAAAGSDPVATLDYTITEKAKNIDSSLIPAPNTNAPVALGTNGLNATTNTSTFYIPFALDASKLKLFGYATLALGATDQSGSYSYSETAHVNTAATMTDQTTAITSLVSMTTFGGLFGVTMPGFFMANQGAEFTAGLYVSDTVTGQKYKYEDTVKPYNATATVNAKDGVAGGTYAYAAATYDSANALTLGASVAHSIPAINNDEIKFVLQPTAMLSFGTNGNSAGGGILRSSERYTYSLTSAFAYDSGTYRKITTTVTGNPATSSMVAATIAIPTAAELRFPGWPFGFMFGAKPYMTLSWTSNTTSATSTLTKTEIITASAATSTTNTTTTSPASTSTTLTPTFAETHSFGIFIPFDGKVRLDATLTTTGLFDFDRAVVQLYIPLK